MADEKKAKDMAGVIAAINKAVKTDVGFMASEQEDLDQSFVYKYSSGILSLDKYLGVGGLLGGRVMNAYGWEGSGKTLTALTVGASMQRAGKRFAFIDAEGTYNSAMAKAVGVDTEQLALFRSTPEKVLTAEDYFNIINILIQNGVELIVVDSVPALIPSSRLTAVVGQGQKATQAQIMSEGLAQSTAYLNSTQKSILWLINQIRMKPMVMFGSPEDHTGGSAIKFYMSYSLEVKKRDDIIKHVKLGNGQFEERVVGATVRAKLHKNKTASIPVNPIEYDIYFVNCTDKDGMTYNAGIDIYKDIVTTALASNVIIQQSSWFSWGGIKENGQAAFIETLRSAGKEALDKIRTEVLASNKE